MLITFQIDSASLFTSDNESFSRYQAQLPSQTLQQCSFIQAPFRTLRLHALTQKPLSTSNMFFGGTDTSNMWNRFNGIGYPIFVQDPGGKDWMFAVHSGMTIHRLKRCLQKRSGVPVELQRLTFGGKKLSNDRTLKELKIYRYTTLWLEHCQDL